LQHDLQPAISSVMKLLEDHDKDVRQAAISCLCSLGAQGMYSFVHLELFALLMPPPSGVAAGDPASNFWGHQITGGS
jgi:hypothetical protein